MLLELKRFEILPGQKIVLNEVTWQEFEDILEDLGERRASRVAYDNGRLEIMTPLPEHEVGKVFITTFVEVLLEELDIDFYPLGSTTFKNELMNQGIEPDNCFYIENEAKIRGKNRLDLTIDPPPDLVLEIDVTSRTYPKVYQALGVTELWRFEKGKLQINVLQNGQYIQVDVSPYFPNISLQTAIPKFVKQVKIQGRNKTVKELRNWIRNQ